MIEAELADGTILEFPDGTPDEVIQRTVKNQVQPPQEIDLEQFNPADFGEDVSQTAPIQEQERSIIPPAFQPQAAIVTGAIAEPIAGLSGLARSILPGEPGVGAQTVESVREALTFKPDPAGQPGLERVAEIVQPFGEAFDAAERFLGDSTLEITGSPALAAAAATVPTAALEALGGFGALARKGGKITKSGREGFKATAKKVDKALVEAAPDIDVLKDTSRAVYKELDNLKVKVKPEAVNSMLKTAIRRAEEAGVDSTLHAKSHRVVELFKKDILDRKLRKVSDLDQLRQKALDALSGDASDARIAALMIDEIDSFMDNVAPRAFVGKIGDAKIGESYKAARKLWGRARRAELIQDAMVKAQRQASGFENGIRIQLRQILNNKKRSRFFTKDEIKAMDDVVQGTNQQNILKLVGRLGFSEGQATNILGGLAGGFAGGPIVPVIGQASRKLAQRSTKKAAELSDAIVKAGPNGRKITEAYLRLTPPKDRNISELADLFLDNDADIDALLRSGNQTAKEAAELAKGRMAFLSGAAVAGAATEEIREE